ncbi:MAG TPA: GNAT family N-acetyltransferase [Firmicutes bacterium]|nr:GNAT family N-acetyltransferase [Bacillota bacterium]
MEIRKIEGDRRQWMDLLLLGDEQEEMVNLYIDRGEMFALYDPAPQAVCIVTDEGEGLLEIKNIAVRPERQRKGYGRNLIEFLLEYYSGRAKAIQAGTGDTPLTVPFYQACGFTFSHRVPDFFLKHYDHPIYEAGVQLRDMVYFRKELPKTSAVSRQFLS